MRRALQTLDPRKNPNPDADTRNLVRDAILQSFYALRETFLEELDLEEPDHPLLISSGRRAKKSGSTGSARRAQDRQRARQDRVPPPDPRIDELLAQLYAKENATAKPWRQPTGDAGPRPERPRSAARRLRRASAMTQRKSRARPALGHRFARPDLRATRPDVEPGMTSTGE